MLVLSSNHSTRLSTSQLEPRRRRETAETMSGLLSVQHGRIHRHVLGSLRDCWTATSKKKECALYTWGYNPDHSEQKMLKSTIKSVIAQHIRTSFFRRKQRQKTHQFAFLFFLPVHRELVLISFAPRRMSNLIIVQRALLSIYYIRERTDGRSQLRRFNDRFGTILIELLHQAFASDDELHSCRK